jgi:hypothetical protein
MLVDGTENEPGTDRQVTYTLIHIWNLKKLISQKLRTEWLLLEARNSMGRG